MKAKDEVLFKKKKKKFDSIELPVVSSSTKELHSLEELVRCAKRLGHSC